MYYSKYLILENYGLASRRAAKFNLNKNRRLIRKHWCRRITKEHLGFHPTSDFSQNGKKNLEEFSAEKNLSKKKHLKQPKKPGRNRNFNHFNHICDLIIAVLVVLPMKNVTLTIAKLFFRTEKSHHLFNFNRHIANLLKKKWHRPKCIFRIRRSHETLNATFAFFGTVRLFPWDLCEKKEIINLDLQQGLNTEQVWTFGHFSTIAADRRLKLLDLVFPINKSEVVRNFRA